MGLEPRRPSAAGHGFAGTVGPHAPLSPMARAPARRSPALSFVVGLAGAIAFEGGFLRLAFAERLPVPPEFLPSPAVAGAAFVLGAALVLAGALLHQR